MLNPLLGSSLSSLVCSKVQVYDTAKKSIFSRELNDTDSEGDRHPLRKVKQEVKQTVDVNIETPKPKINEPAVVSTRAAQTQEVFQLDKLAELLEDFIDPQYEISSNKTLTADKDKLLKMMSQNKRIISDQNKEIARLKFELLKYPKIKTKVKRKKPVNREVKYSM